MNFRRIFEERAYDVKGHVLSLADTKFCSDLPGGCSVYEGNRQSIIEAAEALLGKTYPVLTATNYMNYKRTGGRGSYETPYFERRADMLTLAFAESFEKQGRFTDAIVNLLWMILEETTWIVPAHYIGRSGKVTHLPHAFTAEVDYIDLFAAASGASVAMVYFLVKEQLDGVSPLLCERVQYELNRRMLRPFLDEQILLSNLGWTGIHSGVANNWCPWIISNLLTVCAMTAEDMDTREATVRQAMRLLNNFTASYHDDGGCEEGPGYWGVACCALYDCCCLLYDMTGGYVNMFDDPLLRRMGEYRSAVYIAGGKSLNFADATANVPASAPAVLDWGHRVGSPSMITFGRSFLGGKAPGLTVSSTSAFRALRVGCIPPEPADSFEAPRHTFLSGLQIAVSRETSKEDEGLYLAFKGGHNGESHNHCDVGQIIAFTDGKPLFVDAGFTCYTARTFGAQRYTIWSNCSNFHNTATVNNCMQSLGKTACAETLSYNETDGALTLDLTKVYPEEARLSSYVRSARLQDGTVTVTDTLAFDGEGTVDFHFIVTEQPTDVTESSLRLQGCTVNFDESLRVEVEACDHTIPEARTVGRAYGVESLYRITLRSAPFAAHTFTLTVHK